MGMEGEGKEEGEGKRGMERLNRRGEREIILIIIIIEVYAAPKLSRYMTVLGAYNIKSFTYEINQHTHVHTPYKT